MTPQLDGRRRTWLQRSVISINLLLIAASLGVALLLHYGYGRAAAINRVALGRSLTAVPDDAEPGERVINILLVGSDSSANLDPDDPIQIGRQGEQSGDVIIVAHIDERSGQIALLSLPRDLHVEIGGTGRSAKINSAFLAGGPSTLIDTIENEFGFPIHHYVNVDFAGFQGLVAAVGSVDVYFERPARDWNVNAKPEPRSQTGFIVPVAGCRSLDPEMALAYVRSRYYQTQDEDGTWVTDPTSDLGRIRRQQDFLRRVMKRAIELGARNPFVLRDLIDAGLENVAIDQRLTPQLLLDVGMTYRSFEPDRLQTYSFPVTDGQVGRDLVLLPRRVDAEPLLELFRGAPFDDPTTIDLRVLAATDLPAAGVTARVRSLRQAGWDVEAEADGALADVTGTTVRHGADGRHAAEVVGATLGGRVTYEQVDRLVGRSVVVVLGPDPVETSDAAAAGVHANDTNRGSSNEASDDDRSDEEIPEIVEGNGPDQEIGLESAAAMCG